MSITNNKKKGVAKMELVNNVIRSESNKHIPTLDDINIEIALDEQHKCYTVVTSKLN